MLFFLKNLFTKVISIKVQAMLLLTLAIYLCVGENLSNFRYIAILVMILSIYFMYRINRIYGILWLLIVAGFIYINDIAGLNVVGVDDIKDIGKEVSDKAKEKTLDKAQDSVGL